MEIPLVPGSLLKARLIAAIKAEETEDGKTTRNDRLIAMAISKQTPTSMQYMKLNDKTLAEIEFFCQSYNKLTGKQFKVLGQTGPEQARAMVRKAVQRYKR